MISTLLHRLCVYFVRFVKCVEFFILKNIAPGLTERFVKKIMAEAGVTINGDKPWDPQIHDKKFYPMALNSFTAGVGESYIEGMWDCEDLQELCYRFTKSDLHKYYYNFYNRFLDYLSFHLFNIADKEGAWETAFHYDTGNEYFEATLGKTMQYCNGYWQNAKNLDEAQTAKLDRMAKKINLQPGMRVLEIGVGWGALAKYLVTNYGVSVVGVTISEEQADYARKLCKGLPVEIKVQDYRDIKGNYDRIVSLGMFEHVGPKNYKDFFKVCHRCLSDTGLIYLQFIGLSNNDFICVDQFLQKYMLPNGVLGTMREFVAAFDEKFVMEDWQNIGGDYAKTLAAWNRNLENNREKLESTGKFDEKFFRMWRYYYLQCAGAFQARRPQFWQVVLSKSGIEGGYYAAY